MNNLARCLSRVTCRHQIHPALGSLTSISRTMSSRPPLTLLSVDEKLMQKAAIDFGRDILSPLVKEMDESGEMPDSLIKQLFNQGFMGIEISEEYGGAGSTFFSSALVIEALAGVDMGTTVLVDIQNTLVNTLIQREGSLQQKQEYLAKLASDMVSSFCLTEPNSGCDAFALKTTATPATPGEQNGDFLITGEKMWISNADKAGVFLVMANAEPSQGYRGITCFIVDADRPGITVSPREDKLGIRSSSTCGVHFDNVRVPASSILGEFGSGYKYAIGMLNEGRIGIGAQLVGVSQGCIDHTLSYILERRQFGQRVFDFQAMQHTIAELSTQIEAARLLVYNAARLKEANEDFVKQAAMAKYYSAEIACVTTRKCIEMMGGVGISKQFPIEKYYRDCVVGTIYEGTKNMQLNTIAKLVEQHHSM